MQYLPCMADNLTSPGAPLRSRVPAFPPPRSPLTRPRICVILVEEPPGRVAVAPRGNLVVGGRYYPKRANLVPAMISERIGFEIMRLNGTMYGAQNP
jgi:hypothetical protein